MGTWRSVVLMGSLLLGCSGSPPPVEQGGAPSQQEGTPSSETETPRSPTPEAPTPGEDPGPPAGSTRPPLTNAVRLKSFFPQPDGPSSSFLSDPTPSSLVEFNGKLFFATNYEDRHAGLWTSDGSDSGTVEVMHFPGALPSSSWVSTLTVAGDKLFFAANEPTHGFKLWVSDGTSSGTHPVKDVALNPDFSFATGLSAVGDCVFFTHRVPDTAHTELWKSDGTEAGTVRIKDLGARASPSNDNLVVDGVLYFGLSDPAHGTELWKSDGTEAGTQLLRDIVPGTDSAHPRQLQSVGGQVLFLAGQQLWRTDGTPSGTVLVEDLSQSGADNSTRLMPGVGNTLYLALSDFPDQRLRLYALDVSSTGTVQRRLVSTLANPYAGPQSWAQPYAWNFAVAGSKLYFQLLVSSNGSALRDAQLWVTDGTQAGTQQLLRPLSLSDQFQSELYALDDQVLFAASSPRVGMKPWASDGTIAGTRPVQDTPPGVGGSWPRSFLRVGGAVFFVAYDPDHGHSLWVFPPAS